MLAEKPDEPAVDGLDHEVKFLLPGAAAPAARVLLRGVCLPERPYAESLVESICLDTPTLAALEEKRASEYRKAKVRLRWYDGAGPVRIEVKRREGSRRAKLRAVLSLRAEELALDGLASPRLREIPALVAALGEPLPADLTPVLRLRYRRERFVDPAFGLRLSLDSEIRVVERASWCGALGGDLAIGWVVVELKGNRRDLTPALSPLVALGARRASLSKYAACMLAGAA